MASTDATISRKPPKHRAFLPPINKADTMRPVVKEADKILQEVRGRALYMIPFRMMSHLPGHSALIRPVDTLRVSFISSGIGTSGFRRHEPCCVSDAMPEIGVPMHIIGGNHRHASTRDSGQVLIPCNRVSKKQIRALMRLLKDEDQVLVDGGRLDAHFTELERAFRCLEILATILQGLEPAPKPLTCLQQVQLMRTAVRNDPALDFLHASSRSYGGQEGLRNRIFPGHAGTDDSSIHFLLNNKMGNRHKYKLLAGAKVLIGTDCSFSVPELGERKSMLDVLVHWESTGKMGPFLDTHMSYIGPMTAATLDRIMTDTLKSIESRDFTTTPFNTSAFRFYVKSSKNSTAKSSKAKKKSAEPRKISQSKTKKRKTSPTRKGKLRAVVTDSEEHFSDQTTTDSDGDLADKVDAPLSRAPQPLEPETNDTPKDLTANSKHLSSGDKPKTSGRMRQKGQKTAKSAPFDPKKSAIDPISVDLPQGSAFTQRDVNGSEKDDATDLNAENDDMRTGKRLLVSSETQKDTVGQQLHTETEKSKKEAQENQKLRIALKEAKNKVDEAVTSALKQARESWKKVQAREEEERIGKYVKENRKSIEDLEKLQEKFEKYRRSKENDIAEAKRKMEVDIESKIDEAMQKYRSENKELRLKLDQLDKQNSRKDDTERLQLQSLLSENQSLRKELQELKSSESRRGPSRAVIPSEKMLESMSSKSRRELKRKIEKIEKKLAEE